MLLKQHLDIFQMCSLTSELAADLAAGVRGVLLTGQAVVLGRLRYVINGPLSFNRSLSQDTVCSQRREFPEVFASYRQAGICTSSQREEQDGEVLEGLRKKGWACGSRTAFSELSPSSLAVMCHGRRSRSGC